MKTENTTDISSEEYWKLPKEEQEKYQQITQQREPHGWVDRFRFGGPGMDELRTVYRPKPIHKHPADMSINHKYETRKYKILEEDNKQIFLATPPYQRVLTVVDGYYQNGKTMAKHICDLLNKEVEKQVSDIKNHITDVGNMITEKPHYFEYEVSQGKAKPVYPDTENYNEDDHRMWTLYFGDQELYAPHLPEGKISINDVEFIGCELRLKQILNSTEMIALCAEALNGFKEETKRNGGDPDLIDDNSFNTGFMGGYFTRK